MSVTVRMQGNEWREFKKYCKLIKVQVTPHGNIKAFMQNTHDSRIITHYLGNSEKIKFLKSDWIKHAYLSGSLHNKRFVYKPDWEIANMNEKGNFPTRLSECKSVIDLIVNSLD